MESRILLVDGQQLVRQAVRLLLEQQEGFHVVSEVDDGEAALRWIDRDPPDIAIVELSLPKLCGLSVIERLNNKSRTRCLVLTSKDSRTQVQAALRAGAAGYVLKTAPASQLIEAVKVVADGKYYFSPQVSKHVVDAATDPASMGASELSRLTMRERQVLQLVAEGHSTKEIAQLLGVSSRTTDSHRARMMDKLDIHKVSGLVRFAIREGLVEA